MSLLHKWASQRWWWMISRTFCLISTKQVQVHIPFILMVGQFLLAKTSKHRLIIPCGLWITLLVIIENTTQLLNILFEVWKNHTHNKEKLPTITLCPNMCSLETLSSLSLSFRSKNWVDDNWKFQISQLSTQHSKHYYFSFIKWTIKAWAF